MASRDFLKDEEEESFPFPLTFSFFVIVIVLGGVWYHDGCYPANIITLLFRLTNRTLSAVRCFLGEIRENAVSVLIVMGYHPIA